MSKKIKLLDKEEFALKDLHDVINFLESDGGKKIISEINVFKDLALASIDNSGRSINCKNKEESYDEMLKNQGKYEVLEQVFIHLLNLKELDSRYSELFKQQEQAIHQAE